MSIHGVSDFPNIGLNLLFFKTLWGKHYYLSHFPRWVSKWLSKLPIIVPSAKAKTGTQIPINPNPLCCFPKSHKVLSSIHQPNFPSAIKWQEPSSPYYGKSLHTASMRDNKLSTTDLEYLLQILDKIPNKRIVDSYNVLPLDWVI